jgi:YbbR domain-containing protein
VSDPSLRPTTRVEATVTVPIQPRPVERRITQVPVRARNAGRGRAAQIVPAVVTVTARGPKDLVDGLTADTVSAFVDLAGLGPGRWYNLSVQVESPQDLVAARTEPATVQVRIK